MTVAVRGNSTDERDLAYAIAGRTCGADVVVPHVDGAAGDEHVALAGLTLPHEHLPDATKPGRMLSASRSSAVSGRGAKSRLRPQEREAYLLEGGLGRPRLISAR